LSNLLPDIKIDYTNQYEKWYSFFSSIDMEKDLPKMPEIETNQFKLFLSSRNILAEYYSIQKDELALKRYTVYAPFNGTLSAVTMEVGAYATVGARIAKGIRTDVVEVEVAVDAQYANFIKLGDKVELEGDAKIMGSVVRISGFIDEATQSRLVFVRIDNQKNMPLPGQYLQATFFGKELKNVMEIPRNAVFNHNELYIIEDGRLKKESIEVFKRNENTLLFNGIEEGKVIVVQPLIGVSTGSKVSRLRDAALKEQEKGNKNKME